MKLKQSLYYTTRAKRRVGVFESSFCPSVCPSVPIVIELHVRVIQTRSICELHVRAQTRSIFSKKCSIFSKNIPKNCTKFNQKCLKIHANLIKKGPKIARRSQFFQFFTKNCTRCTQISPKNIPKFTKISKKKVPKVL